jgi:hypothetical protein
VSSWEDVSRIARALPQSSERVVRGARRWEVGGKMLAWERPLRPKEVEALGDTAPDGPILAARVEHLIAKQALLEAQPELFFTTAHFNRSPIVLARLDRLTGGDLEELVTEAWLARAPKRLTDAYPSRRD